MSAATLIAAKGQAVTLNWTEDGDYDTATGAVANAVAVEVVTVGVVLPLSRGLTHRPGTDINVGDRQLLLPGEIAQPPVDATVTIGLIDYTIIEVSPLAPAGEALIYDCIIRGAP